MKRPAFATDASTENKHRTSFYLAICAIILAIGPMIVDVIRFRCRGCLAERIKVEIGAR